MVGILQELEETICFLESDGYPNLSGGWCGTGRNMNHCDPLVDSAWCEVAGDCLDIPQHICHYLQQPGNFGGKI